MAEELSISWVIAVHVLIGKGHRWTDGRWDRLHLGRLPVRQAVLDQPSLLILIVPAHSRLDVVGLLHAEEEAQVVEERHELVGLAVFEAVAPRVLDEGKPGVDNALAVSQIDAEEGWQSTSIAKAWSSGTDAP